MTLAQVKKVALYLLFAVALYAVISFPGRATDFVQLAFEAVSAAGTGLGTFIAALAG